MQHEIDRKSSVIEDPQNNGDVDSSEQSTEQSDHSEEHGHVTDPTGNWQRFAQTKFQVKASHSYCCAALQQPLLPKRDKSDHLVSMTLHDKANNIINGVHGVCKEISGHFLFSSNKICLH